VKRILSISLLFVLLVAAVQPALAFHFCGGHFHSVRMGGAGHADCCGNNMDAEPAAGFPEDGETAFSEFEIPCCSDYVVEIATDTCQRSSVHSIAPAPSAAASFFTPGLPCSLAGNPALPALRLQTIFPPGSTCFHAGSLLALICILRI
jgi:hypothetical protein